MTSILWPGSLPEILIAGYTETPLGELHSFEPEEGDPISRPKGTMNRKAITCAMTTTWAKLDILDEFIRVSLARGSLAFLMTHPRKRTQVKAKFMVTNGGAYQAEALGAGLVKISFALSVTE